MSSQQQQQQQQEQHRQLERMQRQTIFPMPAPPMEKPRFPDVSSVPFLGGESREFIKAYQEYSKNRVLMNDADFKAWREAQLQKGSESKEMDVVELEEGKKESMETSCNNGGGGGSASAN